MSKDELVKLLRLEGYMTYADRKEAADLIDQQAARIAELEAQIAAVAPAQTAITDDARDSIRREALRDAHSAVRRCINVRDAEDAIAALTANVAQGAEAQSEGLIGWRQRWPNSSVDPNRWSAQFSNDPAYCKAMVAEYKAHGAVVELIYAAPPAQTALAGRLASAVELFKRLKRDLMHARRLGADTLANYRRACSNAEGEVEEWLIENAKAPESGSNPTDPKEPT